ncbi:XPC-binding domain-domain-containing protein [Lobosporangium transversale]|uniref:UV excision repair protein RAD23 n=1 Tax=Lobosporangium transversale TaxID=64571 RepID=A0A1Y2G7K1_9FUNG|nr:XPC-binding domain-domain-containing protein [Lobosporangium transversale]ORZ00041.1 XPC-binding domain-domain-containing protein [Lobosporangium transversale]|eukprot:XP_021876082.1 XPC-binding domain-domain-containing protein [Lobosporangium transversale]
MLITIKTLKQESFKVEIDPSDKVLAIKEKVAELQGHPVSSQKLIFSGKLQQMQSKILADENPISQYEITEKDFLVIMVTKPAVTAAPSTSNVAAASTPALPAPAAPVTQTTVEETPVAVAPATSPSIGQNPTPAASTEPAAPTNSADNALLTGTQFETAIQNMVDMGFPRDQCMLAMRASFNNPDRAVEYLMNGIPEHLQAQASAPTPRAAATATPAGTAATTAPSSTSPASATAAQTASSPAAAAQPQNLFTAAAQAAANARRGTSGESGPGGEVENLAFLRDQPQFQQIRELVQHNPDLLQPLLIQLGQSNPHMLQLINQNQQGFLQLLNEGYEGDEGGAPPPGTNHVYVTQEEQEAIQRLENLGFDRQTAVEAFLACDRDEQMAANYLFDHGNDDFEEDTQ